MDTTICNELLKLNTFSSDKGEVSTYAKCQRLAIHTTYVLSSFNHYAEIKDGAGKTLVIEWHYE